LLAASEIAELAGLVLFEPPETADVPEELLDRIQRLAVEKDPVGVLRAFFVEAVGMAEADFAALRDRPIWPVMVDNAATLPAELGAARGYHVGPEDLCRLQTPTLLLVGAESGPELRQVVDDLALGLPRSTVVTLAGQGHGAMCSAPAQFAAVLQEFVDAVGAGRFRTRPGGA
jgi:pimeloyl-ACP methyl ester carboxylesterase